MKQQDETDPMFDIYCLLNISSGCFPSQFQLQLRFRCQHRHIARSRNTRCILKRISQSILQFRRIVSIDVTMPFYTPIVSSRTNVFAVFLSTHCQDCYNVSCVALCNIVAIGIAL